MTEIVHPITGEVLPDDLVELEQAEQIVDGYLRSLRPHYRFRRALRERIAELRGIAVLPRPAFRTRVQDRVARCPRCGLGEEIAPRGQEASPFHDEEEEAAA